MSLFLFIERKYYNHKNNQKTIMNEIVHLLSMANNLLMTKSNKFRVFLTKCKKKQNTMFILTISTMKVINNNKFFTSFSTQNAKD